MAINQIAKIRSLLKGFVIHEVGGEVLESSTSSKTEVTGSIYGGGTGAVHDGQQVNSNVRGEIKSETTDYQTIFIQGDDGIETAVNLENMTIPVRDGHRVILWRLGEDTWFKATNQSMDSTFEHGGIDKILYPKIFYFLFAGIFATYIMSDSTGSGIGFGMFWIMYFLVGLALAMIPCAFIWRWRKRAIDNAIAKKSLLLNA